MEIREEKISEYRETEQVVREAFWNVYAPGCSEHYLVHRMRQCPGFVPALDLVAVEKGRSWAMSPMWNRTLPEMTAAATKC